MPATPSQRNAFVTDWGAGPIPTPSSGPPLFSQASSSQAPRQPSPSREEARDYVYPASQGYTLTRSGDTAPRSQAIYEPSDPADDANVDARASSPPHQHQIPPPPSQGGQQRGPAQAYQEPRRGEETDGQQPRQQRREQEAQRQDPPPQGLQDRTPTKITKEHAELASAAERHANGMEEQSRLTATSLVTEAMNEPPMRDRQDALWVVTTLEGTESIVRTPEALWEASRILNNACDKSKRCREERIADDLRDMARPSKAARADAEAGGTRAAQRIFTPCMDRALQALTAWTAARAEWQAAATTAKQSMVKAAQTELDRWELKQGAQGQASGNAAPQQPPTDPPQAAAPFFGRAAATQPPAQQQQQRQQQQQ